MKQWRCLCGAWVDAGWWRHSHVTTMEPTACEIIAARQRGDVDPLASAETQVSSYMRTGAEETRETPE